MGVKASGGIRNLAQAREMIAARIAAESGVPRVEVIAPGIGRYERGGEGDRAKIKFSYLKEEELLEEIVHMLQRRPCTSDDINRTLALNGPEKVEQLLEPLVRSGRITIRLYEDRMYYQCGGDQDERLGTDQIEKER